MDEPWVVVAQVWGEHLAWKESSGGGDASFATQYQFVKRCAVFAFEFAWCTHPAEASLFLELSAASPLELVMSWLLPCHASWVAPKRFHGSSELRSPRDRNAGCCWLMPQPLRARYTGTEEAAPHCCRDNDDSNTRETETETGKK